MSETNFNNLGLSPKILSILTKLNFVVPTPIQTQAIPVALAGQDLIGIAQTGTGKTLAFGLPILQKLFKEQTTVSLIILPTRELALQVDEFFKKLGAGCQLKTAVLIGGANIHRQIQQLKRRPNVIIGTPGRLIDHLQQKTVSLTNVGILILDEADRMLDMGFAPQIKKVLLSVPKNRQTMLFSATMPEEIIKLANDYMRLPVRVEVAPAGSATANVSHEIFFIHKQDKLQLLEGILKDYHGTVLIFSRTKFGAKKIAAAIRNLHHSAVEIHSDRSLNQRLAALNGFKKGLYRILVATDIAARGLDVTNIELVINYDLPEQADDYVHRIGRTGRADKTGHAISFATPDQRSDIKAIERLINKELPLSPLPPTITPVTFPQIVGVKNRSSKSFRNQPRSFSKNKYNARQPRQFSANKPSAFANQNSRPAFNKSQSFKSNKYPGNKSVPTDNGKIFHPKKPRLFVDDLTISDQRPNKPFKRQSGGQNYNQKWKSRGHQPTNNFHSKPKRAF